MTLWFGNKVCTVCVQDTEYSKDSSFHNSEHGESRKLITFQDPLGSHFYNICFMLGTAYGLLEPLFQGCEPEALGTNIPHICPQSVTVDGGVLQHPQVPDLVGLILGELTFCSFYRIKLRLPFGKLYPRSLLPWPLFLLCLFKSNSPPPRSLRISWLIN